MNPYLAGALALALTLTGACRRSEPPPAPAAQAVDASLAAERDARLLEADAWVLRLTTAPPAAPRERVETLVADVRSQAERARVAAAAGDRARVDHEFKELRHTLDLAIASLDVERRAAENEMAESLKAIEADWNAFRVEASSFNVQGNAEVRRRTNQLDLGRREIAGTFAEMRRSPPERWAALRRRSAAQAAEWQALLSEAWARLPAIKKAPTPVPSSPPTPSPVRKPARPPVQ